MGRAHRDIIVLGASAGGVEALLRIARNLTPGFPAALFVVLHVPATKPSMLPTLLGRAGGLSSSMAADGEPIRRGHILVASPDRHLVLESEVVRSVMGPRENGFRPAVDPLFRSAAATHGRRVIGVVLSGGRDDGSHGLARIKQAGGLAIAQDPEDAGVHEMPLAAIRNVAVDHVAPAAEIAAILRREVSAGIDDQSPPAPPPPGEDDEERRTTGLRTGVPGTPSPFTCPECGGVLWEEPRGPAIHFQCHVGHAFNSQSLVALKSEKLEQALYTALRALEENAALRRRLADRALQGNLIGVAEASQEAARRSEESASLLRQVLLGRRGNDPTSRMRR